MTQIIIKPSRDRDFYVLWSTAIENLIGYGTRSTLAKRTENGGLVGFVNEARLARADEYGSSDSIGLYHWDRTRLYVIFYGDHQLRTVQRVDLEALINSYGKGGNDLDWDESLTPVSKD